MTSPYLRVVFLRPRQQRSNIYRNRIIFLEKTVDSISTEVVKSTYKVGFQEIGNLDIL